jgi:hypothetical protein
LLLETYKVPNFPFGGAETISAEDAGPAGAFQPPSPENTGRLLHSAMGPCGLCGVFLSPGSLKPYEVSETSSPLT